MYKFAVHGDFSRMIYSRHHTLDAAKKACAKLNKKWGYSHPGSEAIVRKIS